MYKPRTTIYRGTRLEPEQGTAGANMVYVDGLILDSRPSQELFNHSPDGFNWGYTGSGPAQLALAILLDYTSEPTLSVRFHQRFKAAVIAPLDPAEDWEIDGQTIEDFLAIFTGEQEATA